LGGKDFLKPLVSVVNKRVGLLSLLALAVLLV